MKAFLSIIAACCLIAGGWWTYTSPLFNYWFNAYDFFRPIASMQFPSRGIGLSKNSKLLPQYRVKHAVRLTVPVRHDEAPFYERKISGTIHLSFFSKAGYHIRKRISIPSDPPTITYTPRGTNEIILYTIDLPMDGADGPLILEATLEEPITGLEEYEGFLRIEVAPYYSQKFTLRDVGHGTEQDKGDE